MPPKRNRTSDAPDQVKNTKRSKPYAYLKPQIRHISERTIKSKWSTLPAPAQDKIRDMFQALERPVIVRQQNDKKRYEAQAAVQAVVKNLAKRLPRMPFPPLTKDSVFEYEAALKEHNTLEVSLSTLNDSIDLLSHEIAKEEALLAKETRQLQEMEKNAKRAEAERKRQMKNEHPVLRQLDKSLSRQTGTPSEFTLTNLKESQLSFNELESDPEASSLLKQLNSHLKSMQSNTAPLTGLKDALARSQTALSLATMPDD
ncbi:CENP-Q, a CENPA-CAD centromere complex subunit-domain-containing protein [Aspergillus karnatakaensis]|uniref:uncharacterized protein n=1 Tax=Aspergillus karnatakaensis TaxID=1810916 RepID=UPI003CCDDFA0